MSKKKEQKKKLASAKSKKEKLNKIGNRTGMHNKTDKYRKKIGAPPKPPKWCPNPDGRPPKLSEDLVKEFSRMCRRFYYIETIADYLEIDMRSINGWRKLGKEQYLLMREDDAHVIPTPHLHNCYKFFLALRKGCSASELDCVSKIASDGSWMSKAWLLERRRPEHYSNQNWQIKMLERQLNELNKKLEKHESQNGNNGNNNSNGNEK